MADNQFYVSVRAQATLFLDHLNRGQYRKAESKMSLMTYFWHGATFAARALGHNLPAECPAVWSAWDQLHTAWCALDRLGDETGELLKPSEAEITSIRALATALRERAIEAGGLVEVEA